VIWRFLRTQPGAFLAVPVDWAEGAGIDPSRKPKGGWEPKILNARCGYPSGRLPRDPRSEALWMPSENTINWRRTA
jgi:hypothetical protein